MMRLDEDEKSREDQFKMIAIQPWRHGICEHGAGTRQDGTGRENANDIPLFEME